MPLNQCVILVGGLGSRLGALTQNLPKPLLPVGGRAFLDFLIDDLVRRGFDDVICLAGYRAPDVQSWASRMRHPRLRLRVVTEPAPCGTAGALAAAKELLDNEFLLLNGDSIFDINLLDFVGWEPSGDWIGAIALRTMSEARRYGVVELKGDVISSFAEQAAVGGPSLINGGIYRLKRNILDFVSSFPSSIEHDVFPELVTRGSLRGRVYDGFFLDIGIPESFEAAQLLLPAMKIRAALFLDRDGVVNKDIGYACRPDQIEWVDGIFDAVKAANDAGVYVFVVTNQSGVARGLYNEEIVQELHRWMNSQFRDRGAYIDEFCYCPHHPSVGNGFYTRVCGCRKPEPGMLLDLARRWPIELSRSLVIGDKNTDLQAARAAGAEALLFRGGSVRDSIAPWLRSQSRFAPAGQAPRPPKVPEWSS